eukprot:227514-Rhodomonas_salina.1
MSGADPPKKQSPWYQVAQITCLRLVEGVDSCFQKAVEDHAGALIQVGPESNAKARASGTSCTGEEAVFL